MYFTFCQIYFANLLRREDDLRTMGYRYNVSCSETNSKNWTQSAVECYQIGCNCSICGINKLYFTGSNSKCMMKYTVIELVRKLGIPNNEGLRV